MKGLKKRAKETPEVLFEAIINRNGKLPKTEKKRMTTDFLTKFLKYVSKNYTMTTNMDETIGNLFESFGGEFVITPTVLRYMDTCYSLFRYCKLGQSVKKSHILEWMDSVGRNWRAEAYVWENMMFNIIISEQQHDFRFLNEYFETIWDIMEASMMLPSEKYEHVIHLFDIIRRGIKTNHILFAGEVKIRFLTALVKTFVVSKVHPESVNPINSRIIYLIKDYTFEDSGDSPLAPILPAYYNPFRPLEYIDYVIDYDMEADYEFHNFLETCDTETRIFWLTELVKAHGNNIKFCNNREEIAVCLRELNLAIEPTSHITDYNVLKKVYPSGLPDTVRDDFLRHGDLTNVPSDDIGALFVDNFSINFIGSRSDAEKQFEILLGKPSGMTYLAQAISHLAPYEMVTFMKAYTNYMENLGKTVEAVNNVSMDIYIASYIKKKVSMDVIIAHAPKMLRYADTTIVEYPVDYHDLNEWLSVAENAPVINITDGLQFNRLMRAGRYVSLNYHHRPFSPVENGIEEVVDDAKDLLKLVTTHPGYYFDIKSDSVKEVVMEALVDKFGEKRKKSKFV